LSRGCLGKLDLCDKILPVQEREISSQETAPLRLSNQCKLVSGAKRAAIYDLKEGNVYSINEAAREIISGSPDKFGFWKKLAEIGLVESSLDTLSQELEMKIPQVGLEFMWLELTERCNQRCLHCYASAGDLVHSEELPEDKWGRIIKEGASLGCKKLQFIGQKRAKTAYKK